MKPTKPFQYRDLYKTLDLYPEASQARINRAYRLLARQHYPRREQSKHHKFVEIHTAYYILSDGHRRHCYDELQTQKQFLIPELEEITLQSREKFDKLHQQLALWELEATENACELLCQPRRELFRKWGRPDRTAQFEQAGQLINKGMTAILTAMFTFMLVVLGIMALLSILDLVG